MTESERRSRINHLIYQADKLVEKYGECDVFETVLNESVEALNCRIERLAKTP